MVISDVIKALQKRLELYGDLKVVFRGSAAELYACHGIGISSVYVDEEDNRCVLSDMPDPFGEED